MLNENIDPKKHKEMMRRAGICQSKESLDTRAGYAAIVPILNKRTGRRCDISVSCNGDIRIRWYRGATWYLAEFEAYEMECHGYASDIEFMAQRMREAEFTIYMEGAIK